VGYTQKQIDKYHRQKYIGELEKVGKNLFRMFRDPGTTSKNFILKFSQLKKKLEERETVQLDSEYHKQLQIYIERVYGQTCAREDFDDQRLEEMRDAEMSHLNRLQKLKNGISYRKDKHKSKHRNEDWG